MAKSDGNGVGSGAALADEDVRRLGDAFAALHRRLDELHAGLLDPASGRGTVAIG